jgi:RimJ/RimL family protein N-acetyltransferase
MLRPMSELVRLRPLAYGDLASLHRWHQTPALWDHLVGDFQPRTADEAIGHMRAWLTPSLTQSRLAVTRAADGALLGLVALSPIERETGEAEFHIFLGEPGERGRGYGGAATVAMLEHAFEALELWRVRLRVLETNAAGLALYARLGFAPEGGAPAARVRKRGADVAVIALGLTEATFRQRQAQAAQRWSARNVQRASG